MPYASITRSTIRTRVSERLVTSFWVTAELNAYINEALRVWNVLTGYNRNIHSSGSLTADQVFYTTTDLGSTALCILRIEGPSNTTLDNITLKQLDLMVPTWYSTAAGTSAYWAHIGLNNVILYPKSSGSFSFNAYALDLMIVPAADGDYIQVGDEDITAIIDYIIFIARLKEGGKEFQESTKLLQNFLRAAAKYNAKLLQTSIYRRIMGFPAQEPARPRRLEHMPPR
jgi:hypothetical protein